MHSSPPSLARGFVEAEESVGCFHHDCVTKGVTRCAGRRPAMSRDLLSPGFSDLARTYHGNCVAMATAGYVRPAWIRRGELAAAVQPPIRH